MDIDFSYPTTRLAKGDFLRVVDAMGQGIAVVHGMVWVTQEGDRRDHFLSDGNSFVFDRPGTAIVEAVNDTRLLVLLPRSRASLPKAVSARHRNGGALLRVSAALLRWLLRLNARHELAGTGKRQLRDLGLVPDELFDLGLPQRLHERRADRH